MTTDTDHLYDGTPVPAHTPSHLAPGQPSPDIPRGRTRPPVATLPPSEFLLSLTGFDEIAIAARFGEKISTLRNDGIAAGRALAFVHFRRAGLNDIDAHERALGLTIGEVSEFFPPEVDTDAEGEGDGA